MKWFNYDYKDNEDEWCQAYMQAESKRDAERKLDKQGIYYKDVWPASDEEIPADWR